MAPVVEAMVRAGIPVQGHIGLTPQTATNLGGFKVQGKSAQAAQQLIEDALALEAAGVFSLVLEGVPWTLARSISEALAIPTIGIGAGKHCDGQILVLHDMLGLSGAEYKFVKRYEDLESKLREAVGAYCRDVREGLFPAQEHQFEPEADSPDKQVAAQQNPPARHGRRSAP